jgi:hypothetical protein
VLETVPRLATGDLDTVSPQAFDTAQRVRPVILADVKRAEAQGVPPYRLARIGVGLCAPGRDPGTRVVVSATTVDGTQGPWTTKQRLILTAMSLETSRSRLAARTPTFALLRSPVTFLVAGNHQKVNMMYALLVDPSSGSLATIVWPELATEKHPLRARRPTVNVFDSPMDIKAKKILGNIPVSWSFAIRELPSGTDIDLPEAIRGRVADADDEIDPAEADELEDSLRRLLAGGDQTQQ